MTHKMFYLLLLLPCFNVHVCFSQTTNSSIDNPILWDSLYFFRVYDIWDIPKGKSFEELDEDEILQLGYLEPDLEESKKVLSLSIPSGNYTALISGMYYADLCFADGIKKTIKMDFLGFKITDTGQYYIFNEEDKVFWENFYIKYINAINQTIRD